jgi:hypothetical protein
MPAHNHCCTCDYAASCRNVALSTRSGSDASHMFCLSMTYLDLGESCGFHVAGKLRCVARVEWLQASEKGRTATRYGAVPCERAALDISLAPPLH